MADFFDEQQEAELRAASTNLTVLSRLGFEGARRLPLLLIVLAASLTRDALCKSIWDMRSLEAARGVTADHC